MAKKKIGRLLNKVIVWGCSLNELDEQEHHFKPNIR